MHLTDTEVLGYHVYGGELGELTSLGKMIINTLNGHSYSVAKRDSVFRRALHDSDILLPDGEAVVLGAKMLHGSSIRKIAGYDICIHLLKELNSKGGSCFFLGAQLKTLQLIKNRLKKEYPNVNVGVYSPPYVSEFSTGDTKLMCNVVNMFEPDVLFVGMTAPKQEKWVHINKDKLNAKVICSIGAVFDFYAGTKERPADWMINYKLEWFGRFLKEPKRMFHRYFISSPVIFVDMMLQKMNLRDFSSEEMVIQKVVQSNKNEMGTAADLNFNAHYEMLAQKMDSKKPKRKSKIDNRDEKTEETQVDKNLS
ncbi:WecB/TagA/CpsF family glycosyltransferase [Saccharicrinis sp. 156]|uniref:WecB/TagA/CpsF family glycosyltransferase n=1 Tax=Saccharicrinis sp. 156 TaxID=3417574 RepID=UPI003D338D12